MFHSGSGALAQRFTRLDAAAPQRAGVMVTTSAEERVTWMVTPTCASSTAEQEDQTTHVLALSTVRDAMALNTGTCYQVESVTLAPNPPYDRPDAAQPFAAPPHTSDPELGSSTTPAALVNTGERHPGNAPPQRDAHELPRRWSGDHPDR